MRNKKAFYHLGKLEVEEQKYKVVCKCETKTLMVNKNKTICRGCGHWLYRNKEIEFKEKMKERINYG